MNDGVLHDKNEPKYGSFGTGRSRLVSLLDIVGGGNVTCSKCGRWQSFSAISTETAIEELAKYGWKCVAGGEDICPVCVKTDA